MPKDIKKLIDGYVSFKHKYFKENKSLYKGLAQGQEPKILIIGCCDSRVDPAILFDCDPGDLFTVRNVANLVPYCEPDFGKHATSAAIEFAVTGLKVRHVVILGHSQCGGIRALLNWCEKEHDHPESFVEQWMMIAQNVGENVLKNFEKSDINEKALQCERQSLLNSLNNLKTFPFIKEALANKDIFLHAWHFCIETGQIYAYAEEENDFKDLENVGVPKGT